MTESDPEWVDEVRGSDDDFTLSANSRGGLNRRKRPAKSGGKTTTYAWEVIDRSWDRILEEDGHLATLRPRLQKRRLEAVQRGILRQTVLIIDHSKALLDDPKDLLPSRQTVLFNLAESFVKEYTALNPLAQLAVVSLRDGIGIRLTGLDAGPEEALKQLKLAKAVDGRGEASFANGLVMAHRTLLYYFLLIKSSYVVEDQDNRVHEKLSRY